MAGLGVGVFDDYKDISQWVRIKHNIKPQSEYKQIYNETYSLYRELYQSTKSLMNRLSKLTK
jgi:sugar (pentulose or hexulose) kinase